MLPDFMIILADFEDALKIVGGIVFFIIWVGGALSAASKKKQKEEQGRASAPQPLEYRPRDLMPPPVPARSPQRPMRQPARQKEQAGKKVRSGRRGAPQAPAVFSSAGPAVPVEEASVHVRRPDSVPAIAAARDSAPSPASSIAVMLRGKKDLRTQLVISEIIQPPLSMRS